MPPGFSDPRDTRGPSSVHSMWRVIRNRKNEATPSGDPSLPVFPRFPVQPLPWSPPSPPSPLPFPLPIQEQPKCHKCISSLQNQSEGTVPENFHTPDPWSPCKSQSFSAKPLPPTPPLPPTFYYSLGRDRQERVASALSRLGLLGTGDPDITLLCQLCHPCNGIRNLSWKGVNQTCSRTSSLQKRW